MLVSLVTRGSSFGGWEIHLLSVQRWITGSDECVHKSSDVLIKISVIGVIL